MSLPKRRVLIAVGLVAVLLAAGVAGWAWLRSTAAFPAAVESYEVVGAALRLRVTLGEADSIVRGEAGESPEKVVVRVVARRPLHWSGTDVGIERVVRVELHQPLGDRAVVDAASGQAVPRT